MAAAGRQAEPARRILARLQRRYDSTEAFSCRFEQTKRVRQLEGDIKLRGDLLFQKPNLLRMRIAGDETMEIYANGRTAWIVDREARDVQEFSLADASASQQLAHLLPPFVLYNFQDLERQFSAAVRTDDGRTTIVLTPRPGTGLPYRLVELEVDSFDRPVRALVQVLERQSDRHCVSRLGAPSPGLSPRLRLRQEVTRRASRPPHTHPGSD